MSLTHDDVVQLVKASVSDVFTTMLAAEPTPDSAYLDSAPTLHTNRVVSLVGLAGSWVGSGSISCSATLACSIASRLMMAEYDAINDDVLDAIAEVTNMVIGNVKTGLEERVGPMGLSIPTVIYGRNFTSRTVRSQEWTVVPFELDGERLEVQLCLAPSQTACSPRLAPSEHTGALA